MTSKRRTLKSSEAKQLLQDFKQRFARFPLDLQSKHKIEEVVIDEAKLYLMDNNPFAVSVGSTLVPSLLNEQVLKTLPLIVVDMGAIPHICNGADVMRPGIREIQGEFEAGDAILVKDMRFGKPIAIGIAEASSESMREMSKGKAARNVHFVGDRFWNAVKKP